MLFPEKVNEAMRHIENKTDLRPDIAIILGSGLGRLAEKVEGAQMIPYTDIPYWPHSTAPGHAGKLVIGSLEGRLVAVMQGRVHYYEGYTMEEVTFPIRVLGSLGIKALLVTNASGGINTDIPAGTITAIEDHINYMGTNPLIGENNDYWGPRFPDMTMAYDREFLKDLERAAKKEGIRLEKGVYIAFPGPSFETPAEIRMAKNMGADLVGMSTVPEVIVAGHMGIRVCGISCIANYAAGITDQRLSHKEVLDSMNNTADSLCTLISAFLREMRL